MGTLMAHGMGRACPPEILFSAILPSMVGPAYLLRPMGILKAPSVAQSPPQIWGMGLQLCSELPTWCGWVGEARKLGSPCWA